MGRKRQDTNHYLTGRDGGRDIDLRAFALAGHVALWAPRRTCATGGMVFEPNLKANLDEADRVYNGINALIDRHIAEQGQSTRLPGSVYQPVWAPDERARPSSISPQAASAPSFGRPASRPIGLTSSCRSSTAPAIL